jgi:hypothetical protein
MIWDDEKTMYGKKNEMRYGASSETMMVASLCATSVKCKPEGAKIDQENVFAWLAPKLRGTTAF